MVRKLSEKEKEENKVLKEVDFLKLAREIESRLYPDKDNLFVRFVFSSEKDSMNTNYPITALSQIRVSDKYRLRNYIQKKKDRNEKNTLR